MAERTSSPQSRPQIERTITLQTQSAQRIQRTGLRRALGALERLEGSIQRRLDPDRADAVETEALSLIEGIEQAFEGALERLLAGESADELRTKPQYSNPETITLKGRTPRALRLLRLLETYDRLEQTLDRHWLEGQLSSRLRRSRSLEFSRRLQKLLRRLVGLSLRIHREAFVLKKALEVPSRADRDQAFDAGAGPVPATALNPES